eukprot:gene16176-7540_t
MAEKDIAGIGRKEVDNSVQAKNNALDDDEYFLERSQSARMTYTKAREFFEEEEEEPELEGDAEAPIESEEKNESPTNKLQNNQLSPKENADCSSRDSDSILQYVKDQKAQTDKISDKIPQIDF